jgi:hypothetical protein
MGRQQVSLAQCSSSVGVDCDRRPRALPLQMRTQAGELGSALINE